MLLVVLLLRKSEMIEERKEKGGLSTTDQLQIIQTKLITHNL